MTEDEVLAWLAKIQNPRLMAVTMPISIFEINLLLARLLKTLNVNRA